MNSRIISTKYLPEGDKYCYCPICIDRYTKEGTDWRAILKPLKKVVIAESVKNQDGTYADLLDERYECSNCRFTNINVETFRRYYTCRDDGTSWNEAPKSPKKIWSAKQNNFVLADWNGIKWVERENG